MVIHPPRTFGQHDRYPRESRYGEVRAALVAVACKRLSVIRTSFCQILSRTIVHSPADLQILEGTHSCCRLFRNVTLLPTIWWWR